MERREKQKANSRNTAKRHGKKVDHNPKLLTPWRSCNHTICILVYGLSVLFIPLSCQHTFSTNGCWAERSQLPWVEYTGFMFPPWS